ncbi:hypothetical protein AAEP93_002594 [Penicillium crustosum]
MATIPDTAPTVVKETLNTHNFRDLYPYSRIKAPDPAICVKVRFDKNFTRLEKDIRKLVGARLESGNLWFQGLSFGASESTLAFLIPGGSSHNLKMSLVPDSTLRILWVWVPKSEAWNAWVAKWKHLPLEIAQQPVLAEYDTADFINGTISEIGQSVRGSNGVPTLSETNQPVACSYGGCRPSFNSLQMIIFVLRS